jgi:SPP1 gp7 family putative phage head morphogenesis protein
MPETPNLKFAIGLSPEKAIEYFRAKGYKISWNWEEVWREAQAKAFTVAKVTQLDVLQDIRNAVDQALTEGQTFRQFQKELQPILQRKGWWGKAFAVGPDGVAERVQFGSPWRLKTIYRTNMQTAFAAGRHKTLAANVKARPWWQYIAVMDARTRPQHGKLHARVYRHDDPFWDHFDPPNGFNCRCRKRALTDRDLKRKKLKPETAAGKLTPVDKLLSKRTGEVRPVTGIKLTDAAGRDVIITPDIGWDYSPGKSAFAPNLNGYHPGLVAAYQQATAGRTTEFKPATTKKAAEAWALENGLASQVKYAKLTDLTLINRINAHLFKLKQITGLNFDRISVVNQKKEFFMAHRASFLGEKIEFRELQINVREMKRLLTSTKKTDLDDAIKSVYDMGWWSLKRIEDAISHEFGHLLTVPDDYNSAIKLRLKLRFTTFSVSKYAETHGVETLAEIYTVYVRDGIDALKKEWIKFFNKYSKVKI